MDLIRYYFRLWRARGELKKSEARYDEEIRQAVQQKEPEDEIDQQRTYWGTDINHCYENIDSIKSMRLLQLAEKYDIEPPPRESNRVDWTEDSQYGEWYLTCAGRAKLRSAIRGEQRERRERWTWWVPIVFGLIGALTGLLSMVGG